MKLVFDAGNNKLGNGTVEVFTLHIDYDGGQYYATGSATVAVTAGDAGVQDTNTYTYPP